MYTHPPSFTGKTASHISTSSSVYSPVDDKRQFPRHEMDEISESSEISHDESFQTTHSYGVATEPSNQTFQTYQTANGSNPSFTSINNSLLRNDSSDRFNDTITDEDATPKIPAASSYTRKDPIDDQTPIIDSNGVFKNDFLGEDLNVRHSRSPQLPQQELSRKFQRLSMTLQTTNMNASENSYQFMNSFQQNVDRVNTQKPSRTSAFYQRINEDVPEDLTMVETSVLNVDQRSETSTISNRLSIDELDAQTAESGSLAFVFEDEQPLPARSRILPLKIKRDDDVPVRKDLADKFDNLTTSEPSSGLNISYDSDKTKEAHQSTNTAATEDENLASLFIRAIHPFDSGSLQLELDASICLSFEKDDLAFVHTIDESGWGEVTLVESLERGWIPMNYFTIAVADNLFEDEDDETDGRILNSHYLKPLFHACGRFLSNPLSHKTRRNNYTFSIRTINSIRDGVRLLLQETDCLSRSNEIVTKRPVVRKSRKLLLADWYNLMVKANDFKGTSNFSKIEILTLMVYQVIRKATSFLQIWSIESKQIIKRENEKKLQSDMNSYPLLATPPAAKQRVTEINGILYLYLGLIIGRLDLIEHNAEGCDILESLTHQIILLLRELLFISKTGSDFSAEKPAELDGSLDTLLSLVSDLVTGVKSLVIKTINETDEEKRNIYDINGGPQSSPSKDYYYTQEGGDLIQIASKMIRAISGTIALIRNLLEVTGDFKLNAERAYPDYSKMRIEPDQFIKKCSLGIAKAQSVKNRDLKAMKPKVRNNIHRYSYMRTGQTGQLSLTANGASLLHDTLINDVDGLSPFSVSNAEFEPFTHKDDSVKGRSINDELLVDGNGNLLGASFKGLVYTLTNESSPPEYFFVSTFFICFRTFANGIDLIEELITRFDTNNKELLDNKDVSAEVKLKNRRRLIVKMFQLWMESYWNHEVDYALLTTLINFFNEGIAPFLPLDAIKLIEVAARLSTRPLIESTKLLKPGKTTKQLVSRSITIARLNRKNSLTSSSSETSLSARYSMVDGYELSKINTNSSTATSIKLMTLPMPLGVGNQTSSSSSLLTKNQLITIEKVNLTYRAILGESWCEPAMINTKQYLPLDLTTVLPKWFTVCDQSWVLSNYRPNLLDFNGLEIAKQLTVIESHIFCSIKPDELLNENFTAKRAYLKLAPNVRQSLLFTNCLSGYVLESILQPGINFKMRVNMVKTWLKVAISCLYLRNFNSLAAIITSLQSHLVTRLTKIWEDLSDKYRELYDYLSGIIHPEKNYNVYRTKLRNFLVSNEYNIPIVPYFSLFLQDLTFVTDGNPNYRKANTFLSQKLINIDKYLKITRIIADIESLQIPYVDPSLTAKDTRRMSFFGGPNAKNSLDEYHIIPLASLQELILLELWKVCQLNRKEEDRAWKLSCVLQPRE